MGAGPINSRIGRSGDAQQVRTKIVDAHRAKPFRPAHHVGRLTDLHRIGDVSLGHRVWTSRKRRLRCERRQDRARANRQRRIRQATTAQSALIGIVSFSFPLMHRFAGRRPLFGFPSKITLMSPRTAAPLAPDKTQMGRLPAPSAIWAASSTTLTSNRPPRP